MNDIFVLYAFMFLVFVQLDGLALITNVGRAVVDIGFQGACTAWRTLRKK